MVQQPSQLWNSTLLEIVIGKSTQVSVTRIADIWAQRPNVTLLEKLNIKDSLEDVVLVEVEEEGERDKDAHLILGSHVIKGKGCRWPRVGGGVEQCLKTLKGSAQGPPSILHSSLQRGRLLASDN